MGSLSCSGFWSCPSSCHGCSSPHCSAEGPVPAWHRPAAALARQAREYLDVAKVLIGFSACLALAAVLRHRAGARASVAGFALLALAVSVAGIARSGVGIFAFSLIHLAIGLIIAITFAFLVVDRGRNPASPSSPSPAPPS